MKNSEKLTVIIGGGFYGLSIALFLRDELKFKDIIVIEKESEMMTRASYVNQARIHNGYHYPRSILTAARSAANFPRFVEEYKGAVVNDFDKYYAIARKLSKVNANQFRNFTHKINLALDVATDDIKKYFNDQLVEDVFKVQEYAFDSHRLRDMLLKQINRKKGITLINNDEVRKLHETKVGIEVVTKKATYLAQSVLNTSYSQMNLLHRRSKLPLLPFKHEMAEMALVRLPEHMKKFSITMMDGPFFSVMPFPTRNLYTVSHVRYTPHAAWNDDENTPPEKHDTHKYLRKNKFPTNYKKMYADIVRYIPELKGMEYVDSITEVKTVLQKSENDDGRPILFKPHFSIQGYACIMGGKLDNIYDVFEEITRFYEKV